MSSAEQFAAPVPAAVKAAAARAQQTQKEYINSLKEGEEEENSPEGGEQEEQPVEAEAEEHVEQPAPPAEEPAPPADDDAKAWKHKYQSLHGRYQSEVPKLRDQVKQMGQEIGNLNRLITTVQRPEPAPAPEPVKSLVTPEEVAEYGPELMDLISRVAKEATAPYEAKIAQLEGRFKQVGTQIATGARAQLLQTLAQAVPDWEAINTSQEFVTWLALPDAYSSDTRHNLLKEAFGRNDTARVVNFFKGFLAEMAAMAPAEEEPGTRTPKTPLKNLAAPGRAKSTASPNGGTPVEKPYFTASQITKFFTEKGMGKWRGREKQAKELEAAIFLAQQEGRIRN